MRQWLIEMRNATKMSQQAVADAAGISQSCYAGIETGARGKPLAVPVAKAIANVLGFDWTMFYEDDAQNENRGGEETHLRVLRRMARFAFLPLCTMNGKRQRTGVPMQARLLRYKEVAR